MSTTVEELSPIAISTKIYPTVAELTKIENNILCTEEGCNKLFTSQSNLKMHIQMHHKQQKLTKSDNIVKQFHCPAESCLYSDKMHFSKLKYLKQHYLRIHADKTLKCEQCEKGFSTEWFLKKHVEMCGRKYECTQCLSKYGSNEALLTHIRRKNHKQAKTGVVAAKQRNLKTNMYILPMQHASIQTFSSPILIEVKTEIPKSRIDKEVQTDSTDIKKQKNIKRKSTQHTQTCHKKKPAKTAETQTIGDCILKKPNQESKNTTKIEKFAIETQTKNTNWQLNSSCTQTSLPLPEIRSDISLDFLNDNMMHSSSQTNFDNLSIFEDSTFGNCNSETQTDLILNDEFFQSHIETQTNEESSLDLCSNTYTQTCNDLLLSALEFTNIQTQTNWPDYDMFVSTETQTLLSHCPKDVDLDNIALNTREISHSETQTEFKQMLEEINA